MEHLVEILIPSITEREGKLEALLTRLAGLIGTDYRVTVSVNIDNREKSTGQKRNELLQDAEADYVCFLDDDDDVSDRYIEWLIKAAESGKDCASLIGSIELHKDYWRPFFHTIKYNRYFEDENGYYRPPNHLNLIRREIAQNFTFPEITVSEDTAWAMKICDAQVLKTEFTIPETIYYYKYFKG